MTMTKIVAAGVFAFGLVAGSAFAQTPQTPAPQNPPAKPPADQPAPPAPARPDVPFPEGAKIAFVFMNGVFNESAEGKAATGRFQEWEKQKNTEIQGKAKQGQDIQAKLQQGGNVLSPEARAQSEKELQKLQRELQALQEDAQQEAQQLQQQILQDFSRKVNPIIEQVATERGLHIVFSVTPESSIAWANPGLDLTAEVVKRLDAAAKSPAPPKK